jgi:hypothetical protein
MKAILVSVNGGRSRLIGVESSSDAWASVALQLDSQSRLWLSGVGQSGDEIVAWPEMRLNDADEISIRVVDAEKADPPPAVMSARMTAWQRLWCWLRFCPIMWRTST